MKLLMLTLALSVALALPAGAQTYKAISDAVTTPVFSLDSLIRPGNATPYAANDVINDSASTSKILIFPNVARANGGGGWVVGVVVEVDTPNVANGTFELDLYAAPVTGVADNAQWPWLKTSSNRYLGTVSLALRTGGTGSTAARATAKNVNRLFRTEKDSRSIYGVLRTTAAWVPGWYTKVIVTLEIWRG